MDHTNEPGRRAAAPADVRVTDVTGDVGVEAARSRFGGIDIPATIAGALAALGTAVLLAGIGAGAGITATSSASTTPLRSSPWPG